MMKALTLIKNAVGGILYPEGLTCAVCDNELEQSSRYGLCPDCSVPFISHCCKRCGTVLYGGREYCDRCVKDGGKYSFVQARAPFPYDRESVHRMVWNLKYGKLPYYAKLMGEPMAELLSSLGWKIDAMTYVPLHPKKERQRTYNQSELLANRISEISWIPVISTLKKTVYSKSSATSLGKEDREKLLKDTFENVSDVSGKRLLLIDDVFTTGATSDECAKTLKNAKAKEVYVLTYATSRGDKPSTYTPDDKAYAGRLRRMRSL